MTPSKTNEVKLSGVEAVIQRICLALSLKKGSFPYNSEMGIDYARQDFLEERAFKSLEMLINEGVYPVWGCRVKLLSYDEETKKAELLLDFKKDIYRTEVIING